MALKYYLIRNYLNKENVDEQLASTVPQARLDLNALVDRMTERGNTLTRTDIIANLNAFFAEIVNATQNGETVNTPLFNTNFSIQGKFSSEVPDFDPNIHKLKININTGTELIKGVENTPLEKTVHKVVTTEIQDVIDNTTHTVNSTLTPNGPITLAGQSLKIEGDATTTGIFFQETTTLEEKHATVLVKNMPSEIITMTPDLTPGVWKIIHRTAHKSASEGNEEIRNTVFDFPLTVN